MASTNVVYQQRAMKPVYARASTSFVQHDSSAAATCMRDADFVRGALAGSPSDRLKNQASQTRLKRREQSPVTQHSFPRRRLIELPQCHHRPSLLQQKRTTRPPGSARHGWGGSTHVYMP